MRVNPIIVTLALASLIVSCAGEGGGKKGTITGTVNLLQRVELPADAELRVSLEDVSLQDAPAGLIAENRIPAGGKDLPLPYTLEYDAKLIEDSHAYSVRGEIFIGGERRFMTTQSYPVLTREATHQADIMLMAVEERAPNRPLVGTNWLLTELGGRSLTKTPTGREPHLVLLDEEQRAVATGGCNQMTGNYQVGDGDALTFSQLVATEKACPDGMDRDAALAEALKATASYRIEGDRMLLSDAAGTVRAKFTAAAIEE